MGHFIISTGGTHQFANKFQCPEKIHDQELGGDEVVSSPNLFYCSGDYKTLATKQPADVIRCQLMCQQEKNLLAVVTPE